MTNVPKLVEIFNIAHHRLMSKYEGDAATKISMQLMHFHIQFDVHSFMNGSVIKAVSEIVNNNQAIAEFLFSMADLVVLLHNDFNNERDDVLLRLLENHRPLKDTDIPLESLQYMTLFRYDKQHTLSLFQNHGWLFIVYLYVAFSPLIQEK